MKKHFNILALVMILCLAFILPVNAIKIAPYSQPLHDIMHWDARSQRLIIMNPEGESQTISWPSTVDLWNYNGNTWTFDLPTGDTFAFGKGVAVTGVSSITLSSALTTGTIRTLTISQTMTVAATANIVEALHVSITSDVRTGSWANAIVGSINYSTSGSAHGMAAAICAEMIPPNSSLARGALYSLDVCMGPGASSTWGSAGPVAFIKFENWGTKAYFDDFAFLFHVVGATDGATHLFYKNAVAFQNCDAFLKIRVGTETFYIPLSDNQGGT